MLSLRALQINLITTKNACVGLQHFYSRDSRFCLSAFIYIFFRFKFCFLLFWFFFTLDKMQVQLGNGRKSNFPVCMILWTPICPPNEYKTWTHAKNADCGLNAANLTTVLFYTNRSYKSNCSCIQSCTCTCDQFEHLFSPLLEEGQFHAYLKAQKAVQRIFAFEPH